MAKISQILSILSFLISSSMLGGGYLGYRYVTSEQFKQKMINEVISNITPSVPIIIDKKLPRTTGEALPSLPK